MPDTKLKNYYKQRYESIKAFDDVSFLDQDKLHEQENKIKTGEISCNTDSPDECLNCGS